MTISIVSSVAKLLLECSTHACAHTQTHICAHTQTVKCMCGCAIVEWLECQADNPEVEVQISTSTERCFKSSVVPIASKSDIRYKMNTLTIHCQWDDHL